MKKLLFGIFAHPDDEGFGPSGTLYKEALAGTEVHLICATRGEAGMNPDGEHDLGNIRLNEWLEAGKLIGAVSQHNLNYPDGQLNNNLYLELANKILDLIHEAVTDSAAEVSFMTLNPNGLTGHVDHIVMSNVTTFTYLKLRERLPKGCTLGKLRYFTLCSDVAPNVSSAWIYQPRGLDNSLVDEKIDVSDVMAQKSKIMDAHHSQRSDAEAARNNLGEELAHECFFYFKD